MRKVLKIRHCEAGYEVRTEQIFGDEAGGGPPFEMRVAYTPEGDFIGSPMDAYRLVKLHGIKPEPRLPECPEANGGRGRICSIGFCEKEQKWYGWSDKAIFGFGIGHTIKEGDCASSSGWTDDYLIEHPEDDLRLPVGFTAQTLADAKRMAIAFADSVG